MTVAPGIDTTGDGQPDEGSLRGSSTIVAERIRKLLQERVENAGLEIEWTRDHHLAYAPEIAAVIVAAPTGQCHCGRPQDDR